MRLTFPFVLLSSHRHTFKKKGIEIQNDEEFCNILLTSAEVKSSSLCVDAAHMQRHVKENVFKGICSPEIKFSHL